MSPILASVACATGIAGLFWLNRDPKVRTSISLWIPVAWLFIAGSRTPSAWFQSAHTASADDLYLEGNPFERNIFLALLILALIALVPRRQKIARILRANVPIVLFLGYCVFSLLWSDYPSVGFKRWIKLIGDLCMVLIVVTDINPSAAFDRLITRIGFLIVPISILFIRYYPDLGRGYDGWNGTMYWTGITTNKNALGLICMVVGLYTLWRFVQAFQNLKGKNRTTALTVNGVIIVMVIYLLHEANSATSTSCFFLGSVMIVAISVFRFARRPAMVHCLAVGALFLAASAAFFNLGGLLQQLGRKADLTGRADLWAIVLKQPVNRLIGTGFESFWVGDRVTTIQKLNGQFANQSHDGYIEILVNLGWVGIGLVTILVVNGYWKIMRAVHRDPKVNCVKLAFFVAMLTYNFTEAAFKTLNPIWICFLWAIVAAPIAFKAKSLKVGQAATTEKVPRPGVHAPVLTRSASFSGN